MKKFLKTKGAKIVNQKGKAITLNGVNFGGWLMMEAYFMHTPNTPEKFFRRDFEKKLGKAALKAFDNGFRSNFITEKDMKTVGQWGFNCLRLPFHYRLIEKAPYKYDLNGVKILDTVIRWAKKYKVYVILDLHAAPGSQNHDWHSDSDGRALLWKSKSNQRRVLKLWEFLADRYKDETQVAGYDLLNESVLENTRLLNSFYKQVIKSIRSVDKNHILFIEGNKWAQDLDCLDEFDDDNHALSIHSYEPLDFTFNFVPHLKYPLRSKKDKWDKSITRKLLSKYARLSKKRKVPIFVGEFGVNYRNGLYNEHKWLKDTLDCFKSFGFHWTYWTYKAVKNNAFPDGIHSYYGNPPWVNRPGPVMGWNTYKDHWRKSKAQMMRSWRTDQFQVNKHILKTLKDAVK